MKGKLIRHRAMHSYRLQRFFRLHSAGRYSSFGTSRTIANATPAAHNYPSLTPEADKSGHISWPVSSPEDGSRLDRFIKRKSPCLPPGLIQRLIRQRRILVNDTAAIRNAHPVRTGDMVHFPGYVKLGLTRGKKKPPPDDVSHAEAVVVRSWELFRDARCVVLNKPAGLASQGGQMVGRHIDGLLQALGTGRYFLVHRLDKEVAGAMVVARDVGAAGLLSHAFRSGMVNKKYWGLVAGVPAREEGVVKMQIDGKRAVTAYRVIDQVEKLYSWVELQPQTGRKHQLRIHCADGLGCALVGDTKYGETAMGGDGGGLENLGDPGLQLMARSIEFPRMTQVGSGGGKRAKRDRKDMSIISVTAPLPRHMRETWGRFGFNERLALREHV